MNQELLEVFMSQNNAINYLIEKSIISINKKCVKCRTEMHYDANLKLFRCNKKNCRKNVSLLKNTIFYNSKININVVLQICYLYLIKTPKKGIMNWTGCSSNTIVYWETWTRQILAKSLTMKENKIGGKDIILEIDETKLGKRK